jgi:hypothetical protein
MECGRELLNYLKGLFRSSLTIELPANLAGPGFGSSHTYYSFSFVSKHKLSFHDDASQVDHHRNSRGARVCGGFFEGQQLGLLYALTGKCKQICAVLELRGRG